MNEETIVAVYDTAEPAMAAVRELEKAGVPSSAISQHTNSASMSNAPTTGADVTGSGLGSAELAGGGLGGAGLAGAGATGAGLTGAGATGVSPGREQGFWSSLFGGEPEYEHDTAVYDRSMESGSIVVTVKAPAEHITQVSEILERHNPIDIDERAASYGTTQSTMATGAATTGVAAGTARTTGLGATASAGQTTDGGTLQLSEETLEVGKRAVNRGTTRVRRYVVETPVEENVTLRDEKVSIERRPVTDGRVATAADFTDKTIEVKETAEEAVVSKTARVREEVVIHKEAAERTETVRDTVRREDVEITKDAATTDRTSGTHGTATATTAKPAI